MRKGQSILDVIIVGGGPAGLSAALVLGRCRRSVAVFDHGRPRNAASRAMHGFLSRDGIPPRVFFRLARNELKRYSNVRLIRQEVKNLKVRAGLFEVKLDTGERYQSRKLLLATGVADALPEVKGFGRFYGKSIFHCPYCDGWEVRDQPLAVYGKGARGFKLALALTNWSRDLILLSDGPSGLSRSMREKLAMEKIPVVEKRIERFEGKGERLSGIRFTDGEVTPRRAVFFNTPSFCQSALGEKLGCAFNPRGGILTNRYEATTVPGLYAAGNILKDVQLVIVAAAEGAKAAFGINAALQKERLQTNSRPA